MTLWPWIVLGGLAAAPVIRERLRKPMDGVARNDAPGDFVGLSGGVTHYRWIGPIRGPVAVCVHGLTTPSPVWAPLAEELVAMGYRVLVYDLYGRGYSDAPGGRQDLDVFTNQLSELLQALGVEGDVTLLGYSMGGSIAAHFTAAHPEMVRRLILIAPAGMVHDPGGMGRFAIQAPFLGDWLFHMVFPRSHRRVSRVGPDPRMAEIQEAELARRGFVPSVLASLRAALSQSLEAQHREIARQGIPVLAIWGQADTVIPLSAMGQLAQWNRDARQEQIPGADHSVAFSHAPQVAAFIRTTVRREHDPI